MKNKITNLYILVGCFIILAGCELTGIKKGLLKLDPPANRIYKYTLFRTSSFYNKYPASDSFQHFLEKNNIDTFKLNFSLENISGIDTLITFRMTFLDFFKNKKANITFKISGTSQAFLSKDPFALYDSLRYFIRGKSIRVTVNHKGVVRKITGDDELIKSISVASQENEYHVKSLISDFIGSNSIHDLFNRFLSATPGFKVNEDDKWVRNITLITKAPVKLSDLYILEQHDTDTAYIIIQSIISAEQSTGGTVYMKGKGKGIAMINYVTGMPYLYETRSETETNTTQKQYEYISKEYFLVKEYH